MRIRTIFSYLALLAATSPALAQSDTSLPKGWWHIPKSDVRFKFGGYVKADLIHDFNPIGSPDFFDVSKIPTDGSEGQTTHFNLKETRLLLDVRTPSKIGDIRAYIETDFYGTSGALRIRHAFIDINDKWLIGQWWSNFMDENIIPNTLDFEKPTAYAFARHGM
nr:porin [Chitinophagaceae bacterium]